MIWRIRGRDYDLACRGWIMGIVNVTPDSFSDGGLFSSPESACEHGLRLVEEGAEILDIGGESTRPAADAVSEEEELRRVIPAIRGIRKASDVLISIDTSKAGVAQAALDEGADIVNDISGLRADPQMPHVVARARAGAVIMHMQGTPRTMQCSPQYDDVVNDVKDFFRHAIQHAIDCAIDPMNIALDPGIGFGKSPAHNRELLRRLDEFSEFGRPLAIGVSRKSFLGWLVGSTEIADRFWPGVALTCFSRERGARILRVHDVKPHTEALRMTEAMLGDD